jgi:hypothetical protein
MTRDEHIKISEDKARERIASAKALIDRIENHGMTLHEQIGNERMRDITSETIAEQHRTIDEAQDLLRLYAGENGKAPNPSRP